MRELKPWQELEHGEEGVSARLVLSEIAAMDDFGRLEVADWLRRQADQVLQEGPRYAEEYVAERRYIRGEHGKPPTTN